MRWLTSLTVLVMLASFGRSADWPGWLGPKRDGTSTEKVTAWTGDLPVVWRVPVGPGHSSPVVAGGVVYLHTKAKDREAEEVTAYDAATGKVRWATSYPREKFATLFGTGPQATPVVADGKVYSFGATGILASFDAAGGALRWSVDTKKEFMAPSLTFGAACSPLIDGDHVVVNVGGKGASVVAFDKNSGKVAWKSLDERASYSSGIAAGKGDRRELVFLTQQGLRGLDPVDGAKRWDYPLVDRLNESSTTPVVVGDLILASSITYGMVGLKKAKSADGAVTVRQVWKNPQLTCYFSTPIPVGTAHVYLVTGSLGFFPTSALHCIEAATGKVLWTKPNVGKYHAALLKTGDDRMLMLTDLGDLVLFQPDPAGYKELARSKVVRGEQIWAHPALVDGKVYFRDEKDLLCLQLPK
ncbi:MAG: PQQ-binding-like beta-propeller repeat protein [Gemmataceae bacterium]